jgi:hypothetical protein
VVPVTVPQASPVATTNATATPTAIVITLTVDAAARVIGVEHTGFVVAGTVDQPGAAAGHGATAITVTVTVDQIVLSLSDSVAPAAVFIPVSADTPSVLAVTIQWSEGGLTAGVTGSGLVAAAVGGKVESETNEGALTP